MYKAFWGFLNDYCKVDAGIKIYCQLHVEVGWTFLGSEFEVVEDRLELIAVQGGHSPKIEKVHYAPEVNHLQAISSCSLEEFQRLDGE